MSLTTHADLYAMHKIPVGSLKPVSSEHFYFHEWLPDRNNDFSMTCSEPNKGGTRASG